MTREPCDRCKGAGLVYMMPDGHEIECPQCEGEGDRAMDDEMTVRDTGDDLGRILGDALAEVGCPLCGYDCAGANPPIAGCPRRKP